MKLKRTVQFIEYASLILIVGLFVGVYAVVSQSGDGKYLIFEVLFSVPFILSYFFRQIIINIFMKKSLYPGAFYSVLEKLGLSKNLEINITEGLLDEIAKPAYETQQFLGDNNLKTEIGKRRPNVHSVGILVSLALFAIAYSREGFDIHEPPLFTTATILFLGINIYLWFTEKTIENDTDAIVKFTKQGLLVYKRTIDWKDIYDWNCWPSEKTVGATVVIEHYNLHKEISETAINITALNISRIDFLLLMVHFKGKYG